MRQYLFNITLFFVFLITINAQKLLAQGSALPQERKTLVQFWQELQLPDSILDTKINQTNCWEQKANLSGCIDAINVFLAELTPWQILIAKDFINLEQVNLVKDFGSYGLFESKKTTETQKTTQKTQTPPTPEKVAEMKVKDRTLRQQTLQALWLTKGQSSLNFDDLKKMALDSLSQNAMRSVLIAHSFNKYLSAAVDPHTYVMPRAYFLQNMAQGREQNYVGIGVHYFSNSKNEHIITRVIPQGGAHLAGVHAGDQILEASYLDATGTQKTVDLTKIGRDEIPKYLLGQEGTDVELIVKRDQTKKTFKITRKQVVLGALRSEMISDIGFHKIQDFDKKTLCDEFSKNVQALEAQGATGHIIDLRVNGGGHAQVALCLLGVFIGSQQPVYYEEDAHGVSLKARFRAQVIRENGLTVKKWHKTPETSWTSDKPVAVLIDAISASASEIFAGTLQVYQRAPVIGIRSFGKGNYQLLYDKPLPLTAEFRGLDVISFQTEGVYHLRNGVTPQIQGVIPDFRVLNSPTSLGIEDYLVSREEDLYINGIPNTNHQNNMDFEKKSFFNKEQTESIRQCVESQGRLDNAYKNGNTPLRLADYQLIYAQLALECLKQQK